MSFPFPATDAVTISADGTNSTSKTPEEGCSLVKIQMPAAMTGTKLTLQGSIDGTTFANCYLDGTVVEFTFSASVFFDVNPRATFGLRAWRLVSDGAEAAERTIGAVMARVV